MEADGDTRLLRRRQRGSHASSHSGISTGGGQEHACAQADLLRWRTSSAAVFGSSMESARPRSGAPARWRRTRPASRCTAIADRRTSGSLIAAARSARTSRWRRSRRGPCPQPQRCRGRPQHPRLDTPPRSSAERRPPGAPAAPLRPPHASHRSSPQTQHGPSPVSTTLARALARPRDALLPDVLRDHGHVDVIVGGDDTVLHVLLLSGDQRRGGFESLVGPRERVKRPHQRVPRREIALRPTAPTRHPVAEERPAGAPGRGRPRS